MVCPPSSILPPAADDVSPRRLPRLCVAAWVVLVVLVAPDAHAQPLPDTMSLGVLHDTAQRLDPQARQRALHDRVATLRLQTLDAEWYPDLTLSAQATYQSEVTEIGAGGTGGAPGFSVPDPAHDQYEAAAEVSQMIYDGGRIGRQRRVERARLQEEQAGVETSLFALRESVSRVFFAALLAQERQAQLGVLERDLRSRLRLVQSRSREGAALASEAAAIEAEIIRVRQDLAEAEAARRTSLAVLEALVRRPIAPGTVFSVPRLDARVRTARSQLVPTGALAFEETLPPDVSASGRLASLLERPEIERFRHTEERLDAQARLEQTATRPRVSAFVRGVYGKPGLNLFDDSFGPHSVAGIRVSWSAFDRGQSRRAADVRRLQAEIVASTRDAFVDRVRRETFDALYTIDRLHDALDSDAEIVALRESVERTARKQLDEGVLLASEYVDRRTDVFDARVRRSTHRIELAEAQARLLRTLGLPLGRGPGLDRAVDPPNDVLSGAAPAAPTSE